MTLTKDKESLYKEIMKLQIEIEKLQASLVESKNKIQ